MAVPRKILPCLVLAALSSTFLPHGSEAALIRRYSFTSDASDAVGGPNATLFNGATVSQEKLVLDGIDDYADLPIGAAVGGLQNFTVEAWVTWDQQARWGRVFDFGTNTSTCMFSTLQSNVGDAPMFDIRTVSMTQDLLAPPVIPLPPFPYSFPVGTEAHIAVSINHSGDFAALYINGVLVSSSSAHISLQGVDLGQTTHNYLGRSQFSVDPYFKGSIDEFRIYDEALTPWAVLRSFQRGPNMDQSEDMPDVVVPATANLFGAGHPSLPSPALGGGNGTRPVLIRLAGGCDVVTFSSVSGAAKPGPGYGWTATPDGLVSDVTDISSLGGIAGILHSRVMFLAGLFLDDSEPQNPAPARLDFQPTGLGDQLNDLYPGLRQIFFIGDGMTQALSAQSFHVPNGATRLYLGFADANSFDGLPGWYDDDFGSMAASVRLCGQSIAAVPQSGPPEFELLGAHPNPVTGVTEIAFSLSSPQSVALKVFDVRGRLVRNLTDGFLPSSPHSARWNRRDDRGRQVPPGIYFYSLNAGGEQKSSRMVVLQ